MELPFPVLGATIGTGTVMARALEALAGCHLRRARRRVDYLIERHHALLTLALQ